ncbi:hypothetical protein L3Y34_004442 [Caenorhabditis briggsae]|uniref:SGNH domain-containing protein n=1 Tax=Caenorhabditis briggsae TaxID=6238 RepID=A0AAE9AFA2_CAEBR|nr:hypothetical protein L3Y34_004442 [Caenorhabditis briggsae]
MNVALINKDANYDMKYLDDIDQAFQNSSGGFQRLDGVTPNMTFDDAARLNEMWNKYDTDTTIAPGCVKRTPEHERWCDYKLKGDEFKLAIFGNSYTVNHHKMFVQECKNRAYNITMDSERGCEPLAASPNDHMCVEKLSEFVEFIESAKPDYAFIFTRFFAVADPFKDKDNQDMEHDRTYIEMKSQLNKFLKSLLRPDGYERGRLRHAAFVKECGEKCELINYLPLFWNNATNMYQYFDDRVIFYFSQPSFGSWH